MQVTVVLLYKAVWFTNEYLYRGKDKKTNVSCTHSHVVPKLYDLLKEYFLIVFFVLIPPRCLPRSLKDKKNKNIKQAKKVL